ncbi:MAG: hypothetical protein ACI4I5_05070 [Acutalibacteraceae bacterium]
MKNIFVKTAALLSALVLLASCGKQDSAPSTQPSAPETTAAQTTAAQTTELAAQTTAQEDSSASVQTEPVEETTEKSDAPQTKAEVIAYVNEALNAVKRQKAGFKKVYKRDATGDINGLPGWLKDVIRQDETSTSAKGKDNTDTFPAAGYSWSSRLRESDVQSYTFKEEGGYYVIRLHLGKEKNPTPGETSSYGRCMSVVTVDSAESIPGISNVSMDYHDGYVYAKVDSESGKVVECTFSAAADVSASVVVLGDISVQNIVSTETFSDFVW